MAKQNNPPQRICPRLMEDMERILKTRVGNGLLKVKDARMPKATELLTRTNGYRLSLRELEMKPEKKVGSNK
jgi:hypothetical protein